ncbi:hypothetical protein ACJX0J_035814, partial [Zea mays]
GIAKKKGQHNIYVNIIFNTSDFLVPYATQLALKQGNIQQQKIIIYWKNKYLQLGRRCTKLNLAQDLEDTGVNIVLQFQALPTGSKTVYF